MNSLIWSLQQYSEPVIYKKRPEGFIQFFNQYWISNDVTGTNLSSANAAVTKRNSTGADRHLTMLSQNSQVLWRRVVIANTFVTLTKFQAIF